jgi:hypothetical protein
MKNQSFLRNYIFKIIETQIQNTINMFNPVLIHTENDYHPEFDLYDLEIIKMTPVGKFIFLKKLFPSFLTNEISFCVRKIKK